MRKYAVAFVGYNDPIITDLTYKQALSIIKESKNKCSIEQKIMELTNNGKYINTIIERNK